MLSRSKCYPNLCHFSNLGSQLCLQHYSIKNHQIRSLVNLVWETVNCVDCLWGFCGFILLRHFTLHYTFSFKSTCRLLSCPYYYPLMYFGSCQRCIWKVLGTNFCLSSIPSVLFPRLDSKHSWAVTTELNNLQEKADYK